MKCNDNKNPSIFCFYLFQSPSKKTSEIYKTGNVEEETKKDGKKISTASTGGPGNQANAMRILVLAQKGDFTKEIIVKIEYKIFLFLCQRGLDGL